MTQLVLKALISGVIVAAASEAAKRSTFLAAVLISLPLTAVLALAWLHAETRDVDRVAVLSWQILWVVVPSLVFFAVLPVALRAGAGFALSMLLAVAVTAVAYAVWVAAVVPR